MAAKKPEKPEVKEIATTAKDIDIFAGYINRLENPDPVLRTEARGKGLKLYDEVDRDAHAGSVLQTRYLSVVGKEWNVEPAKAVPGRGRPASETREQKIADYVSEVFSNCNFDQARQEILQGILYGYYPGEIMWDYSEGDVWIKKVIAKHPRRFIFTPERELRLLTPQNMIEGEPVPDRKFIVFTYGSTDNPYGKGLGQKIWWPVWFKKHGIKFWITFSERFGTPTTVGKYPPGTGKEDQDKLLDAIKSIQQETGIIIPEGMLIELLEAARKSTTDTYDQLCRFMDGQISKAVLGQTATTEGTPGKLGSEEAREQVRQDILKADADVLCELFNNTLIPWIVDYNFPDVQAYPKVWIHTEEEEDLKALAERDKTLTKDIGLTVGKQYFYDTYNIPKPEEDEEVVTPPSGPAGGMGFEERSAYSALRIAEYAQSGNGQKKIDHMINSATSEAVPFFNYFSMGIKRTADRSGSLAELRQAIPTLYDQFIDEGFIEHLAQQLVRADQIGTDSINNEIRYTQSAKRIAPGSFQETLWGPGLPFEEAIDYFRDRAFTISGITKAELLSGVKEELIKSMEQGMTLRDFQKALPEIFDRHGYTQLNPWHIKNVYSTNLQNAYQGGRLRQMADPIVAEALPYWRYIAVMDIATRPEHAAMHGKIFRADHPIWQTWYPPNGFNCRCTVQSISARQIEREGWHMETEDPTGRLFEPVDIETGRKLPARPLMPDAGWDHLPGRTDLRALLEERLTQLRS